jgi:hypothetical protein
VGQLGVHGPGEVVAQWCGLPGDEQHVPERHPPLTQRRAEQRQPDRQRPGQREAGAGGELRDPQRGRDLRGGPPVGVLTEDRGHRVRHAAPVRLRIPGGTGIPGCTSLAGFGGGSEAFGGHLPGIGDGVRVGVADRHEHRQRERGQPRGLAFQPDQQPHPVRIAQAGRVDPGQLRDGFRAGVLGNPPRQDRAHATLGHRVGRPGAKGGLAVVPIEHVFESTSPAGHKPVIHKGESGHQRGHGPRQRRDARSPDVEPLTSEPDGLSAAAPDR